MSLTIYLSAEVLDFTMIDVAESHIRLQSALAVMVRKVRYEDAIRKLQYEDAAMHGPPTYLATRVFTT